METNVFSSVGIPARMPCRTRCGHQQRFPDRALTLLHVAHHHVEAVAEALHVDDRGTSRQRGLGSAQIIGAHLEAMEAEPVAQLARRPRPVDPSVVHERDAMTPLRLVEVRGGDQDGHALARQLDEDVPELATRHRVHAGRGLVEQQDARLRHQRAGERQLLLHPAAQPAGQPVAEAVHAEQREVAPPRVSISSRDSRRSSPT